VDGLESVDDDAEDAGFPMIGLLVFNLLPVTLYLGSPLTQ